MFMHLKTYRIDDRLRTDYKITDLVWVLGEYHRDRIFPCLPSEVRDLAHLYSVPAMKVVQAINILLDAEDDLVAEGEYA